MALVNTDLMSNDLNFYALVSGPVPSPFRNRRGRRSLLDVLLRRRRKAAGRRWLEAAAQGGGVAAGGGAARWAAGSGALAFKGRPRRSPGLTRPLGQFVFLNYSAQKNK